MEVSEMNSAQVQFCFPHQHFFSYFIDAFRQKYLYTFVTITHPYISIMSQNKIWHRNFKKSIGVVAITIVTFFTIDEMVGTIWLIWSKQVLPTPHQFSLAASNRQLQLRKYESSEAERLLWMTPNLPWNDNCECKQDNGVASSSSRCSHKACGLENRRSISLCPVQIWRFFMHMRWCEEATIYVQSLNQIVKNSNPHFFLPSLEFAHAS